MLSAIGGRHFLFQALRALARKSWTQKMPVAKSNEATAFFCWLPHCGSMKLIPLSPQRNAVRRRRAAFFVSSVASLSS
jgi:hypothetical protein